MSATGRLMLRSMDEDAFCALTEAAFTGGAMPSCVDENDVLAEATRRDAEWVMPADFDMDATVSALLANGPSAPPAVPPMIMPSADGSHDCWDHPEPYVGDGPQGHGHVCGLCGTLIQVG